MMANILFYQSGDDSEDSGVKVDHINYTFTRLYSRVCCSIALQCDACINLLCVYARFQTFSIGPINFTLQMIYVGVISALLVFPASIGIVALFRLSTAYAFHFQIEVPHMHINTIRSPSNMLPVLDIQQINHDLKPRNQLVIKTLMTTKTLKKLQ